MLVNCHLVLLQRLEVGVGHGLVVARGVGGLRAEAEQATQKEQPAKLGKQGSHMRFLTCFVIVISAGTVGVPCRTCQMVTLFPDKRPVCESVEVLLFVRG